MWTSLGPIMFPSTQSVLSLEPSKTTFSNHSLDSRKESINCLYKLSWNSLKNKQTKARRLNRANIQANWPRKASSQTFTLTGEMVTLKTYNNKSSVSKHDKRPRGSLHSTPHFLKKHQLHKQIVGTPTLLSLKRPTITIVTLGNSAV